MKRILLPVLLILTPIVSGQTPENGGSREQRVDSLKHIDNPRWWYPGEPITWLEDGILDELLDEEFDGFYVFAESPRSKNYFKGVTMLRSPEGQEALLIKGDCRYISYNRGRTNSSHSIVNGHTHYSCMYWMGGALYFQNGHTNWMRHSQRLYHSRETLQMERHHTEDPPDGVENCAAYTLDDGVLLLSAVNETMISAEVIPAYFLPHTSAEFQWLGSINPTIGKVDPETNGYMLDDYVVYRNGSSFTVIRKSDLHFVNAPSGMASLSHAGGSLIESGKWTAWKGNRLFSWINDTIFSEDIDELVQGASWSPLILPAAPPDSEIEDRLNTGWGWTLAILMSSAFLVLLFERLANPRKTKIVAVDAITGKAQPITLSQESEMILVHSGRMMGSEAFDRIIGLDEVESPETRRSKRSRFIQLVNAEAQARFGRDLIVRVRSEEDKRIMLYHIIHVDGGDG